MSLSTYSGLRTAVGQFLNRDDLTSVIPDFITLAEAQMHRRFVGRLRQGLTYPRQIVKRATSSVADNDEFVAAPSDFAGPITLTLNSDPITIPEYLNSENLQAEKSRDFWTGAPKFYTVVGSELQLYPVADQAYTAELTYISRLPALSDSQTANWILLQYPDVYLYGALVASVEYLGIDDRRASGWETKFTGAIDDICNADPMPGDKSTLRTELADLTMFGSRYNISSDSF